MSEHRRCSPVDPEPASNRSTSGAFGAFARFWGRQRVHVVLVAGLCVMSALLLRGYRDDSPTEDEFTHMVRGIALWQRGDTRMQYGHPPLGNAWTALPVAFDSDNPRIDQLPGWKTATASSVTVAYLKHDYGGAREQLMRSRLAAMALGLVLVAYVYRWCLVVFGWRTALVALALTALHPVIIGQARYVTTDPPAALGFIVALGELVRYLRGDRFRLWTLSLGVALALLTKYSGIIVVPVVVVATGLCAGLGWARFAHKPTRQRWLEFGLHAGASASVVLLCINLAYGFQLTGMSVQAILERPEPEYWVSARHHYRLLELYTPLSRLPGWLPLPVPYTYLYGIAGIRAHSSAGFPSYFWGEALRQAPATYFPVLLAIKNPTALLVLLGLGAGIAARRRRFDMPVLVLLAGILAFLSVAMRSHLAMGVRHVLPTIPVLAILAARAFDRAWELWPRPWARLLLGATLAGTIASAAEASPHYLGYFNAIAGGREGGHRLSIYGEDWGQDRARLAQFVAEHRISPLFYHEQTRVRAMEAHYLHLDYRPLNCSSPVAGSWVAMHALSALSRTSRSCYPFLADLEPVVQISNHIYLYWVPPDWVSSSERGASGSPRPTPRHLERGSAESELQGPSDDVER
ncbi:MAG: glycosyltransferase family 39 protein [Polyangiaceae bacterium]|nr:glycosyltransferase family 39 protein [Polyangiaceae bacterium]